MPFQYAALTDRGRRRVRNEDSFLAMPDAGVYAVADGMGGHAGGDVASKLAVHALESTWALAPQPALAGEHAARTTAGDGRADAAQLEQRLRAGFAAARDAVRAAAVARPDLVQMGTTLTALAFDATGVTALLGHIGDSRLYLLRAGALQQVTRDDTWVQEQIDAGILTPRQARRHPRSAVLTRVIGVRESDPPVVTAITTRPDDVLLLCSDGLTGMISDDDIGTLLAAAEPPAAIAAALVDAANRNGGTDNISVIVLRRSRSTPLTPA